MSETRSPSGHAHEGQRGVAADRAESLDSHGRIRQLDQPGVLEHARTYAQAEAGGLAL